MKKIIFILLIVFVLSACALEIANVIGPSGGWVFLDKGNYDNQWRYMECAQFDIGELKISDYADSAALINKALDLCSEHTGGWYVYGWELPTSDNMRKMLECFSYGLTELKSGKYYLSVNKHGSDDPKNWDPVVYTMDFSGNFTGRPKIVTDYNDVVKIRPVRRF